jgi:tetratricopeptide (TPR) repeat protein
MSKEENKNIVKIESAFINKVGNHIAITNKILAKTNEKSAREYFEKAKELYEQEDGDMDEVWNLLTKAIELKNDFTEARRLRCDLSCIDDLDRTIYSSKAILNDLNKLLEFQPNFDDYLYRSAIKLYFLFDYAEVIKDCSSAIELNNSVLEPYIYRGMARAQLNDFIEAVNDFDKAIIFLADSDELISLSIATLLYTNRGLTKLKIDNYKGALDDFETAIKIDFSNKENMLIRINNNRGMIHRPYLFKYKAEAKMKLQDIEGHKADLETYYQYCQTWEQSNKKPYKDEDLNGNIYFF